jgi:hypothetical protein
MSTKPERIDGAGEKMADSPPERSSETEENSKREDSTPRKVAWRDRLNPVKPAIFGLMLAAAWLFMDCVSGVWWRHPTRTIPLDEAVRKTPLSFAIGFCVFYVLKLLGWWR